MKYLDGREVMVGDIVEITNNRKNEAVVVEVIEPNSPQAIEWKIPRGGAMIDDPVTGWTLWTCMDEDIRLLSRKKKLHPPFKVENT
jgi:hypothetical protein